MSEAMEIDLDAFWLLIDQAKERQGDADEWLRGQLIAQGPERAIVFDVISGAYRGLAHQYGIWCAAAVIDESCTTNSGFDSFKTWLVGQGREVYMAALKDPDSLADVPACAEEECRFADLPYAGSMAYARLTNRMAYDDIPPADHQKMVAELKKDIVYSAEIGYPHEWSEVAAYLPRLTAQHLTPEELRACICRGHIMWNHDDPAIQQARAAAKKEKARNAKWKGGEAR